MSENRVVLISNFSLPYSGIGSWTTMYNYYLDNNNNITDLICPYPEKMIKGINYFLINNGISQKIVRTLKIKTKHYPYLKQLELLLKSTSDKIILHIIDNMSLLLAVGEFLEIKKLRNQCFIQFSYHGFDSYLSDTNYISFFNTVDEIIFLTNASKNLYCNKYPNQKFIATVLHNGIDKLKFNKTNSIVSGSLLSENQLLNNEKCVFLWLSRDLPKKGLDFILSVWSKIEVKFDNIELWIIGSSRDISGNKIRNFGKIPNNDLPQYYKAADVYLFPTLWAEGFGLTLIEALACNCYCIASANGGVPEVLDNGKYGALIQEPNNQDEWISEIEKAIDFFELNLIDTIYDLPEEVYSLEQWSVNLKKVFLNAFSRLEQSNSI